MREIDIPHQAEDQREAAGDEEIEAAERDPVERRVEKKLLLAENRLEAWRPRGEHKPDHGDDDKGDDERPDGMTRDEEVHAPPLVKSLRAHWAGDESRRFAGRNTAPLEP